MSEISRTIYNQLGGNRFVVMTRAKNFFFGDKELSFKIGRNKTRTNFVSVVYNEEHDLYDMQFYHYSAPRLKIDYKKQTAEFKEEKKFLLESYENVYCDQLQELFTQFTGLYTYL